MKKLVLLIILLLTYIIPSYSQNNKQIISLLDSAEAVSTTDPNIALQYLSKALHLAPNTDTIRSYIYWQIGNILEQQGRKEKAIRYYINAAYTTENIIKNTGDSSLLPSLYRYYREVALKKFANNELYSSKDFLIYTLMTAYKTGNPLYIADTYILLGNLYHYSMKYDLALENYLKALRIYEQNNQQEQLLETLYLLGNVYLEQNQYKKALDNFFEALQLADQIKEYEYSPLIYTSLAELFWKLNIYNKTLIFSKKSLTYSIDSLTEAKDFLLMGQCYYQFKQYNTAINYLNKAKEIFFKLNAKRKLAEVYDALGRTYLETNDTEKAYLNLSKALLLREQMRNPMDLAQSYYSMALYYLKTGDNDKAKYNLIKASTYINQESSFNMLKANIYKQLSQLYLDEGKVEKALALSRQLNTLYDSLLTLQQHSIVEKYEIEREAEQKEQIMQHELEQSKNSNKTLKILIVFLIAVVFGFVYLLYLSKKRYKQLKEQKKLVQSQHSIIEKQYLMYQRLFIAAQFTKNNIFIVDTDGKLLWMNESFKKTYKKLLQNGRNQEINLKENKQCMHISSAIDECIEKKATIEYMNKIETENGTRWLQTTLSPLIDKDKVKEIIGVESDVTKHIEAEEKIKQQKQELEKKNKLLEIYNKELLEQKLILAQKNEELRQQQEELRANTEILTLTIKRLKQLSVIVSETDNITYSLDPEGNITWANKAFYRKTGYKLDEFIAKYGKNIKQFSQYDNIEEEFNKCLYTKTTVSFTTPFITKNGHKIWLHSTLTPVLNEQNKVEQIVVIDTDITKLKETEEKLAKQNHEIRSSIEYASRIQKATLPMPIFMQAVFGNNYFIFNQPRDIVSGDFYWIARKEGKVILAVADATGHGIPGAFMSVLGTMALHMTMAKTRHLVANEFMEMLKDMIIRLLHQRGKSNETRDSIDMALCIFDFKEHVMEFSGAYIPAYIVDRKDENNPQIIHLKADKKTIGFDDKATSFTMQTVKLHDKMSLYITTDGFIDQFGGEGGAKKFKRKRFLQMIESISSLPIDAQYKEVVKTFASWKGDNIQVDDVLVFGLNIDKTLLE